MDRDLHLGVDPDLTAALLERVERLDDPAAQRVLDRVAALDADSPVVHESNLCHQVQLEWGNVEEGFAQSDEIFEDTFTFPMVYHYTMEPHAAIAHYTAQGITVWATAQHPFLVRADLAREFGFSLQQGRGLVP